MSVLLEARDVCMYFGGLKAVESVNMSVNQGDIFGIIGPNGAGKTTFFNVCSGIYQPTKGEIILDGKKISGMSSDQIAGQGMARTFQNIQLFRYMSVLDNVKIGFHNRTKAGLWDAIAHTKRYKEDEAFVVEQGIEVLKKSRAFGIQRYPGRKFGLRRSAKSRNCACTCTESEDSSAG